ncbi:MAG: sigma-70 family RNA polymerase sigma factor [Thermoanaerobaculaceae bacterium]|nr:sigma-70 family RNA polymerase sigma factor [Thermoanaerobaculaceae bacterium]TAM48789.1 MAG: sigma-70 family RNA polymerase sigma factor [Acidobacteriota bacterium]
MSDEPGAVEFSCAVATLPPVEAARGAELETDLSAAASLAAAFAALAVGDLDAIGPIYDACAADLFGLALWRTGSREDAADVVQEVFVRLASAPSALGRVRNPRAYLLAMGHSAAVDVLRRRKRTVEADDAVLEPVRPDPVTAADAARASRLVSGLPAAQREAVYLRHFAGLSFAEIGGVTGVPTFTAASRYRLGIGRLRKLMGVVR